MEYQVILGIFAAGLGLVGYGPYLKETIFGRTKPHMFSWLIWTITTLLSFFAAASRGGGVGTWAVGAAGILNFAIFGVALFKGEKERTRMDRACLIAALIGIAVWFVTTNPVWSVIVAATVDTIGFLPTFRKAYKRPEEESITVYAFSAAGFAMSLFALQSINPTTVLFPATVAIANSIFIVMVVGRRATLKSRRKTHAATRQK